MLIIWKSRLCLLILFSFVALSCDKKKPSGANSAVENTAVSAARTDEDMMKAEISQGLEAALNVLEIPVGELEIMSDANSQTENYDFANKRFTAGYYQWLKMFETGNLITITEHQQSETNVTRRKGARMVTVTLTEQAIKKRDPKLSANGCVIIRDGSSIVQQIIRSAPYQSPRPSQSEEYRLVLGTFQSQRSEFTRSFFGPWKDGEHKFRAVLQLNPFTKRFKFIAADWGIPQDDGWVSHHIE